MSRKKPQWISREVWDTDEYDKGFLSFSVVGGMIVCLASIASAMYFIGPDAGVEIINTLACTAFLSSIAFGIIGLSAVHPAKKHKYYRVEFHNDPRED